jgi:competence protein ComFC
VITKLIEITSAALDLVFPPICVHCSRDGALLCSVCVAESPAVSKDVCRKCAEPLTKPGTCTRCVIEGSSLDRLYGSYLYESPVGSAVRSFKFDDVRALGSVLGGMFNTEQMSRAKADFVVPVPMHKSRIRERGYNQSAILAKKLADSLGIEFNGDLLVRSTNTVPQSEQPTAVARRGALSGAIEVELNSDDEIAGGRILVVDDVFTTGSTLNAVAATLKSAGAGCVGGVALTVQPIGSLK